VNVRVLTLLAFAVLCFYAGVAVEAARTPRAVEIPTAIAPVTTTIGVDRSVPTSLVTVSTAHSNIDRVEAFTALAALIAASFLLARLAMFAVRQVRTRRAS
jgi:hypothetical protein